MRYLAFVFTLFASHFALAEETGKPLPRSSPETQGVSSKAVLDFIQSADRDIASFHSFMLVRRGQIVTEG